MIDKYTNLSEKIKSEKSDILSRAKTEAVEIIESSNKLIENTIRKIRESQAEKEKTKKLRKKLKKDAEEIRKNIKTENGQKENSKVKDKFLVSEEKEDSISKGDFVKIIDQDVIGEIINIKGEDVIISFNSVTLRTTTDRLEKLDKKSVKNLPKKITNTRYSIRLFFKWFSIIAPFPRVSAVSVLAGVIVLTPSMKVH